MSSFRDYDRELLFINTSHYNRISGSYEYEFPQPVDLPRGSKISLMSFATYNSTVNVSPRFGNTTFAIRWLGVEHSFDIPTGYYSASDFSNYISFCMLQRNLYLNDSTGKMVSLIECQENATSYAIQFSFSLIPTASQASTLGYTRPAGALWNFPTVAETPQIVFGSVSLGKLFGFQNNLVQPPTVRTSAYSVLSPDTPTISPVSSYLITCSAVNSKISLLPTLLGQVSLNATYGGLVQQVSSTEARVTAGPGTFKRIAFHILSQDLVTLTGDIRKDPELSMVVLLETPIS